MDLIHIQDLLRDLEIDDPAFESTEFVVAEIRFSDGKWLGAYYPDTNTIVISPEASEAVVLHELGHRHSSFYYNELGEDYAEAFRKIYQRD